MSGRFFVNSNVDLNRKNLQKKKDERCMEAKKVSVFDFDEQLDFDKHIELSIPNYPYLRGKIKWLCVCVRTAHI